VHRAAPESRGNHRCIEQLRESPVHRAAPESRDVLHVERSSLAEFGVQGRATRPGGVRSPGTCYQAWRSPEARDILPGLAESGVQGESPVHRAAQGITGASSSSGVQGKHRPAAALEGIAELVESGVHQGASSSSGIQGEHRPAAAPEFKINFCFDKPPMIL